MANFSCYITIINNSSVELTNAEVGQSYGEYKSRPLTQILAGKRTQFQLADKSGPAGSTGFVKYDAAEGVVQFKYDCPWGSSSNELSFDNGGTGLIITLYGENKSGYLESIPDGKEGQFPSDDHPLSGVFVISDPK